MKRIVMCLLVAALLMGLAMPVCAADFLDPDEKGTLTLVMEWDKKPLNSGSLTLFRVGDISIIDGVPDFVLIEELKDCGFSLKDLDDPELPMNLADLALKEKLKGIKAPIKNGEAVFSDLQAGLYVVAQMASDACDGFESIKPFFISLPYRQNGTYEYDRKAQPKVQLHQTPTEPTEPKPTKPKDPTLPQTGQLNWPIPVMAVSGFMLLLFGILLSSRKKGDREE